MELVNQRLNDVDIKEPKPLSLSSKTCVYVRMKIEAADTGDRYICMVGGGVCSSRGASEGELAAVLKAVLRCDT